jgi:pimeloyl-ACP methyl ester carboxylesterase
VKQLKRDGVRLCYEEAGDGRPPLLFVHGWCCDHTYFAPQFERFGRTHRVVAVDLRGHGESDAPLQEYTMDGFADDLAWVCDQLKIERPVVIGHSMGGVVSLVMAARYPEVARAVVLIDAPVVRPESMTSSRRTLAETLEGEDYKEVAARFVADALFIPTDDPELKARVVEAMSCVPQHVMVSAMKSLSLCDTAAAASTCKQPLLFISASRMIPDVARFQTLAPQVQFGWTVGAGHFNQLLVPDQVDSMIERFLALSVGAHT